MHKTVSDWTVKNCYTKQKVRDLGLEGKLATKISDRGNKPRFDVRTNLISVIMPTIYQVVDTYRYIDKVLAEFDSATDAQDVADQLNIKGFAEYKCHSELHPSNLYNVASTYKQ